MRSANVLIRYKKKRFCIITDKNSIGLVISFHKQHKRYAIEYYKNGVQEIIYRAKSNLKFTVNKEKVIKDLLNKNFRLERKYNDIKVALNKLNISLQEAQSSIDDAMSLLDNRGE